jgi:uncharacterized damage-inducible protein DinB
MNKEAVHMDLLDRMLEHDRWTTQRILAICRSLPPEQLQIEFGIGHETIDSTLRHMIANVQVWTELMRGRPIQATDVVENAGIENLDTVFAALYADFAEVAGRLRDDDRLDEMYLDVLDNPPRAKSFGGTIAHVLTHNMHHRAEILHMLGRLGVAELPEGDVLSWEAQMRG